MGSIFGGNEVSKGPSAAEIRAEEEEKARKRNAARIAEQEKKRKALRERNLDAKEESGAVSRKRLFGE